MGLVYTDLENLPMVGEPVGSDEVNNGSSRRMERMGNLLKKLLRDSQVYHEKASVSFEVLSYVCCCTWGALCQAIVAP